MLFIAPIIGVLSSKLEPDIGTAPTHQVYETCRLLLHQSGIDTTDSSNFILQLLFVLISYQIGAECRYCPDF